VARENGPVNLAREKSGLSYEQKKRPIQPIRIGGRKETKKKNLPTRQGTTRKKDKRVKMPRKRKKEG